MKGAGLLARHEDSRIGLRGTTCENCRNDNGVSNRNHGRETTSVMRNLLAAATAALITVAPAIGQPVIVSPEQRAHVKKYIVEEKIRPTKLGPRVAVGATIPEAVELMPVPESWGATL